jgi:hypothetical protein
MTMQNVLLFEGQMSVHSDRHDCERSHSRIASSERSESNHLCLPQEYPKARLLRLLLDPKAFENNNEWIVKSLKEIGHCKAPSDCTNPQNISSRYVGADSQQSDMSLLRR